MSKKGSSEETIRTIRRKPRRQHSAEEKMRIVMEGLRGEETIAELCRREGISQSLTYKWSKEFLEAGKSRLSGDVKRQATTGEVKKLRPGALVLDLGCGSAEASMHIAGTYNAKVIAAHLWTNPTAGNVHYGDMTQIIVD
jgi:transposase